MEPEGGTSASAQAARVSEEARRRMIAEAAYYRAERRAFKDGDPAADWLMAEAQINRMLEEAAWHDDASDTREGFAVQLEAQLREVDKGIEALTVKRDAAERKLAELRTCSADAWRDLREGAQCVWKDLRETASRVAAHFK